MDSRPSCRRWACSLNGAAHAPWCKPIAATAPADREEVTRYLYSHPETFRLRLIPVPSELDRDDLRLTVEHEEDWEHLHTIYDALGHEGFEWRQIADLLHRNPDVLAPWPI